MFAVQFNASKQFAFPDKTSRAIASPEIIAGLCLVLPIFHLSVALASVKRTCERDDNREKAVGPGAQSAQSRLIPPRQWILSGKILDEFIAEPVVEKECQRPVGLVHDIDHERLHFFVAQT